MRKEAENMAIVNDAKLESLASFIVNNEVNGNCACCSVLGKIPEEMQKEINAPCKRHDYEDEWCYDCPFYSKEDFIMWIKKPYKKLDVEGLKKPKKEDFTKYVNCGDALFDRDSYINALEEYCINLKNVLAETKYDLEIGKFDNRELSDKLEQIRGIVDENC